METTLENIKMQRYPAYKDSGVEWIGDVPFHWEVKKFKRVFHEIKKRSNSELNCGSISFGKVIYKADEKIPESTKRSYQVVLKGDFLVNPLNLNYDLISLRIALSEIDVVVSSGYIVLSNSVQLDKNYYKYFLHRFDVAFMKLLGSGVRQTLNYNDIANCDLVFPPITEQTRIATFLDGKTAQIDQAIAQKERLIELLKERRQILIHNAVTRGLDPNVRMKESGVEWIGMIPEHWTVKRLKFLSTVQSGITLGKTYAGNKHNSYPYLRVANVQAGYFDLSVIAEIQIPISDVQKYLVRKGDILVTEGGDIDKLGRGTIWQGEIENCLHQNHIFAIRVDHSIALSEFIEICLGSDFGRKYFTNTANKTTNLASTNSTKLGNFPVPIPTLSEQFEIVNYMAHLNKKIVAAIVCKQSEIEKLKEYKATLINSAVTGKIKI